MADVEVPEAQRMHLRETRALGYLALVAAGTLIWLAMPVATGLFLGALIAFTLQGLYQRMLTRGWRPGTAAVLCAVGAALVISASAGTLAALFITRGVALVTSLPAALAPGGGLQRWITRVPRLLRALHLEPHSIATKLQEAAMTFGTRAVELAAGIAGATFSSLLLLLFMSLATFFVLRNWNDLVERAELMLPFERRHTHALLDQFRSVGRRVLRGTVLTGIVQGFLAAIGYWVTGVPDPAFFGVVTAVASLVPAIGTVLVWIPIGLYLVFTGHLTGGIAELIYGAMVVGVVTDYVIRPRLVGSGEGVPAILTFVSLFGGVALFGLVGLVLGPVIATLSIAVLRTYATEVKHVRTRLVELSRD